MNAEDFVAVLQAAQTLALSEVCSGKGQPGRVRVGWGHSYQTATGRWSVVDKGAYDTFKSLLDKAPSMARHPASEEAVVAALREAFQAIEGSGIKKGFGPVAPTFDSHDRAAEYARGGWYIVEGESFDAFVATIDTMVRPARASSPHDHNDP